MDHIDYDMNKHFDYLDKQDDYEDVILPIMEELLSTPQYNPFTPNNILEALALGDVYVLNTLSGHLKEDAVYSAGVALHNLVEDYWHPLALKEAEEILRQRKETALEP